MSQEDGTLLLLDAAAQGRSPVGEVIEKIGLEQAADILAHELLYRSCVDELAGGSGGGLPLLLIFDGPAGLVEKRVVLGGEGDELPQTVLHIDPVDAAMCLFGPREAAVAPSLVLEWPDMWPDFNAFLPNHVLPRAALDLGRRLTRTLARKAEPDLSHLAIRYASDKWGAHRYAPLYEQHLAAFNNCQVKVLEIGVGGGELTEGGSSLRMWKHFFPRGLIFGIDIVDKKSVDEPRISTHLVDQGDPGALDAFARQFGPFDVVIDDGSHYSSDVITSFQALFPHVSQGGVYAIEDLQASYWSIFRGNEADLNDPKTSMGFLKQLVDGLHHADILAASERTLQPTDQWISGLHFYHNLAFVEKCGNREPSPLARMVKQLVNDAPTGTPA
jgi:hypothetical protein